LCFHLDDSPFSSTDVFGTGVARAANQLLAIMNSGKTRSLEIFNEIDWFQKRCEKKVGAY
jgi:hypothetical protein